MSQPSQSVSLVVPLYNEVDRLDEFAGPLIEYVAALPAGSELVLVDDGSTDKTAEVADRIAAETATPVRVLRQPHRGKGAAVAAGIQAASARYVAFCDVDLSTPLADLNAVVDAARRAPVLAIGSRDLTASRLVRRESRIRETLGRAYNRLVQAAVAPGVVDTQCGAKAARREVWDAVLPFCRQTGFAWDAEVVGVALAAGVVVRQVPVEWSHDERSKVNVARDGLRMAMATPGVWASTRRAARSAIGRHSFEVASPETVDAAGGLAAQYDTNHWWFRSKAALVTTALRRVDGPAAGHLVDIGAGAGGVTALLGWRTDETVAIEQSPALAALARSRHGLDTLAGETTAVPVRSGSAGVVCLLDVLEHLDDPDAALRSVAALLSRRGVVAITVPGHAWLWSRADHELGHLRRYRRADLIAGMRGAGLEPILVTHVFAWLVPPAWATRRATADSRLRSGGQSRAVAAAALVLTAVERFGIGRFSSPIGTTILAVGRRR